MTGSENNERGTALETREKLSEKSTIKTFSKGFQDISKEYSKCHDPKSEEARNLALKQLQTLKSKITKYREDAVNWLDISEDTRWEIISLETNFEEVINFLSNGINNEAELYFIRHHANMDTGEVYNKTLLGFLPSKYTENRKLKDSILKKLNLQDTFFQINAFLEKKTNYMPAFTNDDFKKYPELITTALSRPNVILNIYEDLTQELSENKEFVIVLNTILVKEYPKFFGQVQGKNWYNKNPQELNFSKISTLLNIIKYRPEDRQGSFIDMMDSAKKGDSDTALKLYEDFFAWTEIGENIWGYFQDSAFITCLKKNIIKTFDNHKGVGGQKKGSIYDIIHTDERANSVIPYLFSNFPKKNLHTLLSHLPEIETACSHGDISSVKWVVDNLDINDFYKARFFIGLSALSDISNNGEHSSLGEFYFSIWDNYREEINTTEEKGKLERKNNKNEGGIEYTIIQDAFPWKSSEELKPKNEQFHQLLKNYFNKEGEFTSKPMELVTELTKIFAGNEAIIKAITSKNNAVKILNILNESVKQEIKQTTASLEEKGFKLEEWKILPEKNKGEVLIKLNDSRVNLNEKIWILKRFWIKSEIFEGKSDEEKERMVNGIIWQISGTERGTNIISSIAVINSDPKALRLFQEALNNPNGDFTKVNEEIARHEEIDKKKQEESKQQEQEKNKIDSHTDKVYNFTTQVQNNFSKIPVGETITTYIGNKLFEIYKDTKGESTVTWDGMKISGIDTNSNDRANSNILEAMNSLQFLKENGLAVFNSSMPAIIDAINNRPWREGKERINLSDGINSREQQALLQAIGQIVDIGTPDEEFDALKKNFHTASLQSGGLLSRLQKKGYANNDIINIFAITEKIKNQT